MIGSAENAMAQDLGQEFEERLRLEALTALDSAGAGLWSLQVDTNQVWVTQRTRELFQFGVEEEITNESFRRVIYAQDRERVGQAAEHAIQTGEEFSVEFRVVLPDGSLRWLSARGRRHCDAEGRVEELLGASVDITERKRMEEQLRESEQRFRTLVEQAGDGFELLDEAGRYLDVNAATLQQLGYTREEMLRLSVFDVDPLLQREQFAEGSRSLWCGAPLRIESVHRRKDGTTFPVEVTISGTHLGGRRCAVTLVRDISERKRAEEALTKSYEEIKQLKDRLQAESEYLKAEIKVSQAHGEIIGRSQGIKKVLHQVEQVALAECAVLLSGETGTGKELIAQEIHRLSRRRERHMVLVNCAALPSALVESELFGRERGAYTGALSSQVGRFEVADGSTIFLDEVGELSLEVQAKLLRVLQQGEFQRLGSPRTHKVDVRVIAATNRDLAGEVRKGRFREDLYYRLKVFPIEIPPLRERVEDIPLLVFSFVEEFSTRMGKKITKVPRKAMEALQRHSWPGNIRELRNVIEHSVILSSADTLKLSAFADAPTRETQSLTLAEAEREHILRTLESTGWRIKGARGAAERLDLKPSTLYSRMQKLGIPHRRQKDEMATEV
jgi:PAS domain S-box-containing protein